jgi:hypothetical protein
LTARLATEAVRRFDTNGDELNPLETREALGFLGVERAFDPDWELALGGVGHAWHEPGRDRSTIGATARVEKASRSGGRALQANLLWTGLYHRAGFDGEASMKFGPIRLRPGVRFGWGERLPLQATFPLGGDDGFPGLHLGERRGDREALFRLLLTYVLKGPFVGRIEVATGRTALGGPVVDSDSWIVGARAGLGAETPVGPVRFEYGVASGGRGAVFVRLGRWF